MEGPGVLRIPITDFILAMHGVTMLCRYFPGQQGQHIT